jgi:hypothetical protein
VVFGLLAVLAVAAAAVTVWLFTQARAVDRLTRGVGDTWFLSADGNRWFRMDESRRDVPLSAMPVHLRHAFIAIEDHRFYRHPGVDPLALGRAVFRNLRSSGTVEGGSTISQQLARTLFLSNRKTYGRKLREAVLALMIEARLSKDQVLELYLNRIYLGSGVYGVETMAGHLFGKPASELTLAESALIAGLARAPSTLSPWSNLDAAVARSHVVLARMRQERLITPATTRTPPGGRGFVSGRVPARARRECGLCEGVSAPALPRPASAAIIRPTGRSARPSCPSCRPSPTRRWRAAWRASPAPGPAGGARRPRSGDRRHPGDGRRPGLPRRRRSTARRGAAASRDRRSSRSSMRRRSSTASRPCRFSTGWRAPTEGPAEWRPRNASGALQPTR